MSQTKSPLAVDPQAIAHAAAERLLAHALDYYEMVEHAAHEWQALASHYEAQFSLPYIVAASLVRATTRTPEVSRSRR